MEFCSCKKRSKEKVKTLYNHNRGINLTYSKKISSNLDIDLKKILSSLLDREDISVSSNFDNLKVNIESDDLFKVVKTLKDNDKLKFSQLIDLTAVDYPDNPLRFNLIYVFLSIEFNTRLIVNTFIPEDMSVDSITSLFPCANWYEREVWDLFGISFKNHPDLRRLLTDYGFSGYPLRKDFPLSGNIEVRYDMSTKKVVYEPVKLTQDFREFDFESPWEGSKVIKND